MASNLDVNGDTTTGPLLRKLRERNIRYPRIVMSFFLNILNCTDVFRDTDYDDNKAFVKQAKESNIKASDKLSFQKLQSFQHIFNKCPMYTK